MRIDLITKEYPPHIYGGAGVHVAELVRVLRQQVDVKVRCFGDVTIDITEQLDQKDNQNNKIIYHIHIHSLLCKYKNHNQNN